MKKRSQERNEFFIRPAGRHILTIGGDLIKDPVAAIVELVKNSYDADAKSTRVILTRIEKKRIRIVIEDDGHGMGFDDVVSKWLIPSTDDKVKRRVSPGGRIMQGRKGIGRFAASILGNEFFMETRNKSGEKTTVFIDWDKFIDSEYLDEVPVLIERTKTDEPPGTRIEITGDKNKLEEWSKHEVEELINELRKLVSPLKDKKNDVFNITVIFNDFPVEGFENEKIDIKPYPLINNYDYKLQGKIFEIDINKIHLDNFKNKAEVREMIASLRKQGQHRVIIAQLTYRNRIEGVEENINKIIQLEKDSKYCGMIQLDLRVFDRDPESIEQLIKKGLKDPDTGRFLGKREARELLNKLCGVSIYRGDFRIRPYGNPGYDWLELDKRRVQNPSFCIGSNQIVGYIKILPEEESNLEEKSARDGLKENAYYRGLKKLVQEAISELEVRRFDFRRRTGRGRKLLKIERELEKIFDFSSVERKIVGKLEKVKVSKGDIEDISKILEEEEKERNKLFENIKEIIAIYQGQATLGKIVMVIQHEGRKPLSWFKNQMPYFEKYAGEILRTFNQEDYRIIQDISRGSLEQAGILINLFNRLDPLSIKKRGRKKAFYIKVAIHDAYRVFENELKTNKIKFIFNCSDNITFRGWKEDLLVALTNLIDNSIYWMSTFYGDEIKIDCYYENENIIIDYYNNGPPIERELIEKELIFEPGFSKKDGGTGIGLPIAGEAIARNGGELKAIYTDRGAYFRIELEVEQ